MENGHQFKVEASNSKYDCLLFDLDDALYPFNSGISAHVRRNVMEHMIQKLYIDAEKVLELCLSLYKTYGTTFAGLKAFGYDFDYDDFHSFVHETLSYNILKPDPVLKGILQSLPVRKIIFTNADDGHAVRVLHRLGTEDCFERIISFDTLNSSNSMNPPNYKHNSDHESKPITARTYEFCEHMRRVDSDILLPRTPVVCKPFEDAFEKVFKIADIDPQTAVRTPILP